MPTVEITVTAQQVARLREAWEEEGAPLETSVLKALASATKDRLRKMREEADGLEYVAASQAARDAEDVEFGAW
jgi:hypothetical protein